MASVCVKKKVTFCEDIKDNTVITKEITFLDNLKKYNNNDKPYYVNKLDQLTFKLCSACRPDEFEEYHMKHDTPGYQYRTVLDCVCGREATLDNILFGCSHCTCVDEVTRNKLYISEMNKVRTKLRNEFIVNMQI